VPARLYVVVDEVADTVVLEEVGLMGTGGAATVDSADCAGAIELEVGSVELGFELEVWPRAANGPPGASAGGPGATTL